MSRQINRNEFVVRDEISGELQVIDMDTGEVVSSATNLIPEKTFAFSYEVALLVCQKVSEGYTMQDIDRDPDLPPLHVIQHWRRSQPMFNTEVMLARKQRADVYHDQVADIAKLAKEGSYITREEIANAKLAADQYRWLAEKGNPESYGNKVTHEGSTDKPITMRVINTGISRQPLPDIIINSNKEVQNVETTEGHDHGIDGDEQKINGEN